MESLVIVIIVCGIPTAIFVLLAAVDRLLKKQ